MCLSNTPTECEGFPIDNLYKGRNRHFVLENKCGRARRGIHRHLARHHLTPQNCEQYLIEDLAETLNCCFDGYEKLVWPRIGSAVKRLLMRLIDDGVVRSQVPWEAVYPDWTAAWLNENWDGEVRAPPVQVQRQMQIAPPARQRQRQRQQRQATIDLTTSFAGLGLNHTPSALAPTFVPPVNDIEEMQSVQWTASSVFQPATNPIEVWRHRVVPDEKDAAFRRISDLAGLQQRVANEQDDIIEGRIRAALVHLNSGSGVDLSGLLENVEAEDFHALTQQEMEFDKMKKGVLEGTGYVAERSCLVLKLLADL